MQVNALEEAHLLRTLGITEVFINQYHESDPVTMLAQMTTDCKIIRVKIGYYDIY